MYPGVFTARQWNSNWWQRKRWWQKRWWQCGRTNTTQKRATKSGTWLSPTFLSPTFLSPTLSPTCFVYVCVALFAHKQFADGRATHHTIPFAGKCILNANCSRCRRSKKTDGGRRGAAFQTFRVGGCVKDRTPTTHFAGLPTRFSRSRHRSRRSWYPGSQSSCGSFPGCRSRSDWKTGCRSRSTEGSRSLSRQ